MSIRVPICAQLTCPLLKLICSTCHSASSTTSPVERQLILDLLAAEAALDEYQSAKVEKMALQNLARKHEALGANILAAERLKHQSYMNHSLGSARYAEPCIVPVKHSSSQVLQQPPQVSDDGTPSASYGKMLQGVSPFWRSSLLRRAGLNPSQAIHPEINKKGQPPSTTAKAQEEDEDLSKEETTARRRQLKCWDVSISFPSKLFDMLQDAEREGHAHIISFLPDGKAFMIHKPEALAHDVLPKYFRTSRLSSLQKQLSLYGFKRIRSGKDLGAIQHEFFQRDCRKLVANIKRKKQRVPED